MWGQGMMGPGMSQRMQRQKTYMQFGVPSAYRGQRNPLPMTQAVIREGGANYAKQCASCHGARGMGDGEAGKSLNPSPALLAHMIQMPMSVDEYLLWSISDGG
jgi:mono/diheme cytochrome c family protein